MKLYVQFAGIVLATTYILTRPDLFQYSAASDLVKGQDTSVLLFLARAYYQLGSRESSFPAMSKALSHCMKAAHLKPHDMAILHNIAMIQQKTAEVILALDPSKRSLQEVEQVIEQAKSSTM